MTYHYVESEISISYVFLDPLPETLARVLDMPLPPSHPHQYALVRLFARPLLFLNVPVEVRNWHQKIAVYFPAPILISPPKTQLCLLQKNPDLVFIVRITGFRMHCCLLLVPVVFASQKFSVLVHLLYHLPPLLAL